MSDTQRTWGTLDPFFEPGPILGRKVANVQFLHAFLAMDPFDEYHFFLGDKGQENGLRKHLRQLVPGLVKSGRVRFFDRRRLPEQLAATDYHCFHLSDCITHQPYLARLRNRYSRDIFPVTGTIHSLSYANFGNAFLRHLWPGTTGRDAIVCTSGPGRRAVEQFIDWLRGSYNLDPASHPAPQLANIPLGVDCDALVPGEDRVGKKPVRILVFGRISHHSKMDILPLIRALHTLIAQGMDPKTFKLVLAGWVDKKDDFLPTLKEYVANAGFLMTLTPRPDEATKTELFQTADIVVSIADNPQETFGISLAEAGAFGLPVIASEYDGYRDIIEHGKTGLLVPTMGSDHTPDADLLAPILFDNQYHLLLAQRTVVEVPPLAEALRELIESPDKRRAMGRAARQRVSERFTWKEVVRQHLALWEELRGIDVDPGPLRDMDHPLTMPYGRIFGHYTTRTLDDDIVVRAGRTGDAFYRGRDFPTLYSGMRATIDPEIAKKLVFLARKPIDTGTLIRKLVEAVPGTDAQCAKNHVLWSLKHDILEHGK